MRLLLSSKVTRFLVIGGLSFISDYAIFIMLLKSFDVTLFVSNAAGLITGFIISFLLNRVLVFNSRESEFHYKISIQIGIYIALLSINTVIGYFIIVALSSLGLTALAGKIIAMLFIAAWNFLIYREIIFKSKNA